MVMPAFPFSSLSRRWVGLSNAPHKPQRVAGRLSRGGVGKTEGDQPLEAYEPENENVVLVKARFRGHSGHDVGQESCAIEAPVDGGEDWVKPDISSPGVPRGLLERHGQQIRSTQLCRYCTAMKLSQNLLSRR